MFGDNEFENSRSPSPWDPFLPSPPSEPGSLETRKLCNGIPKLVPEVEEGNIEYKLKLTDISPARFTRLVTQLKWRLLEGGGQAFYELGVADSGALIGLSPADLEESLETLEMMAGEIGASVIVVKEIEVPPAMVTLADKVSEYIDPETGEWTDRMSNRRAKRPLLRGGSTAATPNLVETETDLSAPDTDDGSSSVLTIDDSASLLRTPMIHSTSLRTSSDPNRPFTQSSPLIEPLDDSLALFSMEPEPEFPPSADLDLDLDSDEFPEVAEPVDVRRWIEDVTILAVYKPRPVRRRISPPTATFGGKHGKRLQNKGKEKKKLPWHNVATSTEGTNSAPMSKEAKILQKRLKRDKRREEKRKAEEMLTYTGAEDASTLVMAGTGPIGDFDGVASLTTALDTLHVSSQAAEVVVTDTDTGTMASVDLDGFSCDLADLIDVPHETPKLREDAMIAGGADGGEQFALKEPRLIVEALVVRKMSLDEAFLDFGGLGG